MRTSTTLRTEPADVSAHAPEVTVSLLWHPRLDADAAHRWLRGHVREVCAAGLAA